MLTPFMTALLHHLIRPAESPGVTDVRSWLRAKRSFAELEEPFDRAVAAAVDADRPAWALASAHQGAIRYLLPYLNDDRRTIAAFCVTEDRGPHPRHIHTTLKPTTLGPFEYRLKGHKRWATMAPAADLLLVVASVGWHGRLNQLRLLRLPADREGVVIEPIEPTSYAPEVPHAVLRFDDVGVHSSEIEDLDAYRARVKPFRVLEELFGAATMLAAHVGIGIRYGWPKSEIERCCGIILGIRGALKAGPHTGPGHIAVAGLLELTKEARRRLGPEWQSLPEEIGSRWLPAPSKEVGHTARQRRRETAWAALPPLSGS